MMYIRAKEIKPKLLRQKQVGDYSTACVYQITYQVFMVEQSIKFEGQLMAVYYTTLKEALLIFDEISDERSIVECVARSRAKRRLEDQPKPRQERWKNYKRKIQDRWERKLEEARSRA